VTSWDTLGILLWFGLPAWAGLSLYRLIRFAPEEEPLKWEGLTPTLFRGLLFCVLGHLAYAGALPLLRQWPPLGALLLPHMQELKQRLFDAPYLLTLTGVVVAAAGVGGAGGLLSGWGLRGWRRLRRRAVVSPRTVWEEVFGGAVPLRGEDLRGSGRALVQSRGSRPAPIARVSVRVHPDRNHGGHPVARPGPAVGRHSDPALPGGANRASPYDSGVEHAPVCPAGAIARGGRGLKSRGSLPSDGSS
jgi:hypothetical protein